MRTWAYHGPYGVHSEESTALRARGDVPDNTRADGHRARRPCRLKASQEKQEPIVLRRRQREPNARQREEEEAQNEHVPPTVGIGKGAPEHRRCRRVSPTFRGERRGLTYALKHHIQGNLADASQKKQLRGMAAYRQVDELNRLVKCYRERRDRREIYVG
jgi:hypothetical protein